MAVGLCRDQDLITEQPLERDFEAGARVAECIEGGTDGLASVDSREKRFRRCVDRCRVDVMAAPPYQYALRGRQYG
jgi:hypothetical protein